jgi:hypothetical protein
MTVSEPRQTLGVIVATIGDRPELRRLIESLLAQVRPIQQLRIVVDGIDTSLVDSIVAELRPRLGAIDTRVLTTGASRDTGAYLSDAGYGVAVNTGLETLDTDLYAFLDDDDEVLPQHFANLEAALDPASGKGVSYSRVAVISADGRKRLFQTGPLPVGRISAFELIGRHPVLLPSTLIHSSVLDRLGGRLDATLDRKADTDTLARLGAATEFAAVDEATYVYYRSPHGGDVRERTLAETVTLLEKHESSMTRRERWISWDSLTRAAARDGLPDVARAAAAKALSQYWSTPPRFAVDLYLRLRRWETPRFISRIVRRRGTR